MLQTNEEDKTNESEYNTDDIIIVKSTKTGVTNTINPLNDTDMSETKDFDD